MSLLGITFSNCNRNNSRNIRPDSDTITVNEKKNDNEDFFIFLEDFSLSPEFQKTRIKFPLQDCYLTEEFNDTCEYIQMNKWVYLKLVEFTKSNSINVIYDNFKKEFRDTDERVYAIQGIENDISNFYYFKRIEGLWYLIKREDFSY